MRRERDSETKEGPAEIDITTVDKGMHLVARFNDGCHRNPREGRKHEVNPGARAHETTSMPAAQLDRPRSGFPGGRFGIRAITYS